MRQPLVLCSLAAVAVAPALAAGACSAEQSTSQGVSSSSGAGAASGAGGAAGAGHSTGGAGGGLFADGGDGDCTLGQSCGDGGVCTAGGVCCQADRVCAAKCCAEGELCSFQKCVTPGASCIDATECADDQYCEYGLSEPVEADAGPDAGGDASCQGAAQLQAGKCLPRPPECAPDEQPGDPPSCLQKCEYHPPSGQFAPEVKYSWGVVGNGDHNVMMTPIVTQLDDDNCDGVVDERDIPEIVFTTFGQAGHTGPGVMRVVSVVGGKLVEKWTKAGLGADRQLASGNVDGAPGNEVVACGADGVTVYAFTGDGQQAWKANEPLRCFQPAIADLDADGAPEVVVEGGIAARSGRRSRRPRRPCCARPSRWPAAATTSATTSR
ncbi:MAG: VCBS repeat-containing protein [Deltaproteobacteria bacterium]|nr:VCBS repeat-containing protein [Deltaproteobacteria bacterium]